MKISFKNLMFGALFGVAALGGLTATAGVAKADDPEECDACILNPESELPVSGYQIYTGEGEGLECVESAPQCEGGGGR